MFSCVNLALSVSLPLSLAMGLSAGGVAQDTDTNEMISVKATWIAETTPLTGFDGINVIRDAAALETTCASRTNDRGIFQCRVQCDPDIVGEEMIQFTFDRHSNLPGPGPVKYWLDHSNCESNPTEMATVTYQARIYASAESTDVFQAALGASSYAAIQPQDGATYQSRFALISRSDPATLARVQEDLADLQYLNLEADQGEAVRYGDMHAYAVAAMQASLAEQAGVNVAPLTDADQLTPYVESVLVTILAEGDFTQTGHGFQERVAALSAQIEQSQRLNSPELQALRNAYLAGAAEASAPQ